MTEQRKTIRKKAGETEEKGGRPGLYTYHHYTIHLELEGIRGIHALHLVQKLNHHGTATLWVDTEEEKALDLILQTETDLPVRIYRQEEKQEIFFCGKLSSLCAQRQQGLLTLRLVFDGYTRDWDRTQKKQSFCRRGATYAQVIEEVLSAYEQKEIRDEVSEGAQLPGMLLQYEETDWAFLQRLASHFSTFLLADNTAAYGRVYFGLPVRDRGKVLKEQEFSFCQEKGYYRHLPEAEELPPQEMIRWQVVSPQVLFLGEQVKLDYIEVVVTGIEVRTVKGEPITTYELSRRQGVLAHRKHNPLIPGMSLVATVKERWGNQLRVHLDVDAEAGRPDEKESVWFTYAIEMSNFYCMPEEESKVQRC